MPNDVLKSGIYCIENISTSKKYIGQSVNISDRWKKHISELNRNSHHNDYLQKAWNKYGKDDFRFYVLEYCSTDELNNKEDSYIKLHNTMDRDYGYNLKSGGQDHNYQSEEVRHKISESNKKTYQNSNLKEIRQIDALNQWSNPGIKEKIMGENNGMYGRHHSEETKRKISEANKGTVSWKRNTTTVFCIELNKVFNDATEAGKELSIPGYNILKVCQGKRKSCGGYTWKFLNYEKNNIS